MFQSLSPILHPWCHLHPSQLWETGKALVLLVLCLQPKIWLSQVYYLKLSAVARIVVVGTSGNYKETWPDILGRVRCFGKRTGRGSMAPSISVISLRFVWKGTTSLAVSSSSFWMTDLSWSYLLSSISDLALRSKVSTTLVPGVVAGSKGLKDFQPCGGREAIVCK